MQDEELLEELTKDNGRETDANGKVGGGIVFNNNGAIALSIESSEDGTSSG